MKKKTIYSEIVYVFAIVILAFAVALESSADFGVSMVVAPAYILHLKFSTIFTFGQAEYIVQAVLLVLFCILMKKVKLIYFTSFLTSIIYGVVLDLFRLIPFLNPEITPPGSQNMIIRIVMFVSGVLITAFSIALFFKVYIYPEVYDMFVKYVALKYNIKQSVFKTIFDISFLVIAVVMSLCFFKKFNGIGIGTIVISFINGFIIGQAGKLIDKFVIIKPKFEKLSKKFED